MIPFVFFLTDKDEESGVEEHEEDDEEGPSEGEDEEEADEDDESESGDDSGPDLAEGKGKIETSSDEDDDDDELEEYLHREKRTLSMTGRDVRKMLQAVTTWVSSQCFINHKLLFRS